MARIPRDKNLDSALALLSDGYTFISQRCQRYQSDVFGTRLMFRNAICMLGAEAAEVFYEPNRFTRRGALPVTTLKLLQDKGSVQLLDGEAHRRRKQMFMSLMTPENIRRLGDAMEDQWSARIEAWRNSAQVVLHREVQEILCRAVCAWAGVPLSDAEAGQRTREFATMIDGAVGPRNWRGQLLRMRTERWIGNVVERVRGHEIEVAEDSPAHVIAWHKDADGKLLETTVAVVELLNVLRPTVAVANFVTFAALALHEHPECRQKLQAGDDYLEMFVQEVRQFYPFFPLVGGRVLNAFDWRGQRFASAGLWGDQGDGLLAAQGVLDEALVRVDLPARVVGADQLQRGRVLGVKLGGEQAIGLAVSTSAYASRQDARPPASVYWIATRRAAVVAFRGDTSNGCAVR